MKLKIRDIALECLFILVALTVVFVSTCLRYGLVESTAWHVPAFYQDDAIYGLAHFKSVSQGECLPYSSFIVLNLGAPFSGNWNDFPVTSPGLVYLSGVLAKWLGIGFASNTILVLAHLVSALAMFVCLKLVGSARIWAAVFSICFGLSPFLFSRGFNHIVLTFAYSVPLALVIGLLVYRKGSSFLSGWRLAAVLAISFYFGGIFPYYTAFYLIIMAFTGLYCFVNEKKKSSIFPFLLIAASTFTNFFLLTEPFRQYARENGPNEFAVSRFYNNLQVSALRPVELFLPGSSSRVPILKQLSAFYENQDIFRNNFSSSESMAAYMGLPAILGFCLLCCMTGYFIFTRRQQLISGWFWLISFFMAFAVVGGLNGFLGLGKFFLLRSSNRVSIYIVAACLFFLALLLTRCNKKIPPLLRIFIALALVGFAVWEALPNGESLRAYNEKTMSSDREIVAKLETHLPKGAMVFNYPVIDFPESGTYAFLRPYLFSNELRFSSGSVKGRARESWQYEIENLPPLQMIAELQKIGFSGILVYKGSDLSEDQKEKSRHFLEATCKLPNSRLESADRDFVFVRISPDENPRLPKIKPQFLSTWWPTGVKPAISEVINLPEDARWCAQKIGELEIFNEQSKPQSMNLIGTLFSPNDAKIEFSFQKKIIKTVDLKANNPELISIQLASVEPGATRLIFQTDSNPIASGGKKFNFAFILNGNL